MQKVLDKKNDQKQRSRAASQEPPIDPPRIDWQQLLADLKQHGCSLYRIATVLGVKYSTAQRWRRPREDIGYGYGRALIWMHARHCGAGLTLQRLTEAEDSAYTSRA